MVKVIMGLKGSGKTKQLIDLINAAASTENGNVVAIERKPEMTFDIHYKIRLVDSESYAIRSYEGMKGFICGLYAGNYDITHIFIDSLTKIIGAEVNFETEKFLDWLNAFSQKNGIKFTITISDEESLMSEGIKKYF